MVILTLVYGEFFKSFLYYPPCISIRRKCMHFKNKNFLQLRLNYPPQKEETSFRVTVRWRGTPYMCAMQRGIQTDEVFEPERADIGQWPKGSRFSSLEAHASES